MIDAAFSREERRVILVDGFNVLHAVLIPKERDSGWWRREVRERLLRRVVAWPDAGDEVWVAFDGSQPSWSVWAEPVATLVSALPSSPIHGPRESASSSSPAVQFQPEPFAQRPVVHSVFAESADDWIVRRARRANHPERTVVVTSDRQVAGRARSAGCEIWSPRSFISRCPPAGVFEDGLGEDTIADSESRESESRFRSV
jgi:predicted RNA-binding protein with PIN domain